MPSAARDMEDLDRTVTKRIYDKIKWLAENFDSLTPEPLEGNWKGKYKFRVGDYRVAYTVNRDEAYLMVHMVRHRREAYRRK
ncbi:MAG: type II toxin-antitoxin system RelE/ParE family toxin [Chloroflexi bacterium]|nr:type II toxin-antitoxin system RelE/ParE family toxin [Chloroflexota bacterium]